MTMWDRNTLKPDRNYTEWYHRIIFALCFMVYRICRFWRVFCIIFVITMLMVLAIACSGIYGDELPVVYHSQPAPPETAQDELNILNADPSFARLGYYFECRTLKEEFPVLLFHTSKSFVEIKRDWMRYGKLVSLLSNNWHYVTNCRVVVGLDMEYKIAFITTKNGGFRLATEPTQPPSLKPEKPAPKYREEPMPDVPIA